ncbi:MAG: CBS domain-containing protein [Candidatus Sericytochromatia bacterium]
MTTIRDVMTAQPTFVSPDATLATVARKMLDSDTGLMPIMDGPRLCGVITDRDIVVRAIAQGADPTVTVAKDFCTTEVDTVSPDADVEAGIALMEDHRIRRLVVMDGDRLVGVVSLGDLAITFPDAAEDVLIEVSRSPKTLAHDV